jgi:hypothetical protein
MKYPAELTKEWLMTCVVSVDGPIADSSCWIWTGTRHLGYGVYYKDGRTLKAHRLAFTLFRGDIPPGSDSHHRCKNRACVNPWHIDILTKAQHSGLHGHLKGRNQHKGKTHCGNGHAFTPDNTKLVTDNGYTYRRCKTCDKKKKSESYKRNKASQIARRKQTRANAKL